ncbi:MAG: restriction endonuclease, partial [Candidatus Odinarchaeota archaeon]
MSSHIERINYSFKNETDMIGELLVPLFERIGYHRVYNLHGNRELGKDLVLIDKTRLGGFEYTAVVVKKGDVNVKKAREIRQQAVEAYGSDFRDPDRIDSKCPISKVIIVVSGKFGETGKENLDISISDPYLRKNIEMIDGNKLVNLLEQYWPE